MKQDDLNENHLRRLATSIAMVDAAAARILDLLDERTTPKTMTVLDRSSLSAETRAAVRDLVSRLQPMAARFGDKYSLEKHSKDLRRSITAEVAQLWTILEDSHADKMKGMGPVRRVVAEEVDKDVDELLRVVHEIMREIQPADVG
jgi:hypothetical protein